MLAADFEPFLIELNRASAAVILPLFRNLEGIENKKAHLGDFDPVTAADRGAEAAIRRLIGERFPGHGVIGEEYGEDRPDAEFVWVIDPVDGTRAFVAGLPVWTTLIALRHQGRPVLGSIGQPYIGELFLGHAGAARVISGGASRPLTTRRGMRLSDAIIATTDPGPYMSPGEIAAWERLRGAARLARLGCDAYAYAMVADGHIDLVVEASLKSWDVDCIIPILEGAGGASSDWTGQPIGAHGGRVALAGDRALIEEALPMLRDCD